MSFLALIELTNSSANTVTVQNWTSGNADYRQFWDFVSGMWTSGENADTKSQLSTSEGGNAFSVEVDVYAGVSGNEWTQLRNIYYSSGGQQITSEFIIVDPSGTILSLSAQIVSGIGEWGDLRWSKIYGIPLEQWNIVVNG